MGLTTENLKSWSVQKYVVAVLWMEGRLSTADIARQVKWTGGQVRGFYTNEFKPPRVNMSRDERQEVLSALKEWRKWFGVFVESRFDDRFRSKEIHSERLARLRQEAAARAQEERENPPPTPTKKEQRRLDQEAANRRQREAQERALREFGYAPRGRETDALDWLCIHALGDRDESVITGGLMSRDRRKEALLKFRVHAEGASISPLRAQDYEAARGAGKKIALPEFRKHCIDMLGGARTILPAGLFQAIDMIVMHDEFIWNRVEKGRARTEIYEGIRYGADLLAFYYQIIAPHEFKVRWGEDPPRVDLPRRSSARDDSRRAQEIIDELTKAVA